MVQTKKKIALLHRYPQDRIRETNAAFPYLKDKGIDVLTFKKFDRMNKFKKFFKSLFWIFYAPYLASRKEYDVVYCDDSFPFYPALVKIFSPRGTKVVIRLGDLHLMYYTSGFLYRFFHEFEKIGWKMADKIICISDAMTDFVSKEIRKKVFTILDPVDPKDFPYRAWTDHGSVMFHGLLTRNKNVDILLRAAKLMPDVSFVIVGDGPDRKRLQKIAPINVFFKGWVPFQSMYKYIRRCAIGVALRNNSPGNDYVMTSPFIQYGIMGKPCVVSKRKVFGDYPFQFSTVEEFVQKIRILLKGDYSPDELREFFLEYHNAEKISEEIWSLLSA
jgi:glycosyltransferase involved in cell wall biosynthesis